MLAAGALLGAVEGGRLRWVIVAASLVGAAFLTKYLQAYLVLPGFALTFLVAASGSLRRRLAGLVESVLSTTRRRRFGRSGRGAHMDVSRASRRARGESIRQGSPAGARPRRERLAGPARCPPSRRVACR